MSHELAQPQDTPPRWALVDQSDAPASTQDEEGYPPGFGLADFMPDAGNDSYIVRHLDNFTKRVLWKATSPLIRKPPMLLSLAKVVLPLQSKRLAA